MSFQLNDLMKQAQEMQKKMQQAQKEIEDTQETGESGGGAVKVTLNGKHNCTGLKIDPELSKETLEVLEDLITAAINDAVRKIAETSKEKLGKITAGIKLPDNFGTAGLPD